MRSPQPFWSYFPLIRSSLLHLFTLRKFAGSYICSGKHCLEQRHWTPQPNPSPSRSTSNRCNPHLHSPTPHTACLRDTETRHRLGGASSPRALIPSDIRVSPQSLRSRQGAGCHAPMANGLFIRQSPDRALPAMANIKLTAAYSRMCDRLGAWNHQNYPQKKAF